MAAAYRLLAEEQYARGWDYPLHLGVTGAVAHATSALSELPRSSEGGISPLCVASYALRHRQVAVEACLPLASCRNVGSDPRGSANDACAEAGEGEDGRMKSAIGIGSLLLDGLGDTIRVSLTEDPWRELDPCRRLAELGARAAAEGWGVEPYGEATRDTKGYSRRQGVLPEQRAEDGDTDYRGVLHRCALCCAELPSALRCVHSMCLHADSRGMLPRFALRRALCCFGAPLPAPRSVSLACRQAAAPACRESSVAAIMWWWGRSIASCP